jgi:hypothetical protein
LAAAFASDATQIVLDGSCVYPLSESGNSYAFFDFWHKQGLVIDGRGATIERLTSAPDKGVLAFFQSQNVTIKNLTIRGGKATTGYGLGGGLWFFRTTTSVVNVRLLNNTAKAGGGLEVEHSDSQVIMVNSVLANNRALEYGAAIFAKGGLAIHHSTIFDGSQNPLQGILTWAPMQIDNSMVSGFNVGILSAGEQTVVSEDHNAFAANQIDMHVLSAGEFVHGGASKRYEDLRFVDPAQYDFRLRFTSPAIDKGSASLATTDADGLPRPFAGGQADLAHTASTVQHRDYHVVSQRDPAIFASGRPQVTVVDAQLRAALAFAPIPDGYHFANYSESLADDL